MAPVQTIFRALIAPLEALQTARGMLFPWIAVLIGCGIGAWFTVGEEPGAGSYSLAALVLVGGLALAARIEIARPLALAIAAIAAGWIAAGVRAHSLDSVGSSRVDLQACKLEYSIVSPK